MFINTVTQLWPFVKLFSVHVKCRPPVKKSNFCFVCSLQLTDRSDLVTNILQESGYRSVPVNKKYRYLCTVVIPMAVLRIRPFIWPKSPFHNVWIWIKILLCSVAEPSHFSSALNLVFRLRAVIRNAEFMLLLIHWNILRVEDGEVMVEVEEEEEAAANWHDHFGEVSK